ncbi:hypothetical protein BH11PSE11_BH11PSE11_09700 [soil metagenome]
MKMKQHAEAGQTVEWDGPLDITSTHGVPPPDLLLASPSSNSIVGDEPAKVKPGRLFYVVGASGVGKDALLRWVAQRIPVDTAVIVRRTITRQAEPNEQHEAVDEADFQALAAGRNFSMQWQANGLFYGVRRGFEKYVQSGRHVIINGSREYLPQLHRLFPAAQVVWIEADAELIRCRLEARGRDQDAALLQRLQRGGAFAPPEDCGVVRIENNGPIEVAGQRLLDLMLQGSREASSGRMGS